MVLLLMVLKVICLCEKFIKSIMHMSKICIFTFIICTLLEITIASQLCDNILREGWYLTQKTVLKIKGIPEAIPQS